MSMLLNQENFRVMKTVSKIVDWLEIRKTLSSKQIGFVPTMGHLHDGHLSLYKQAREENEVVVASIFVNPTQFNQQSDFDNYPRTLERDKEMLSQAGVDYLWLPDADEMYPDDYQVRVCETEISRYLEGEFRPGHFDGMLTVVMKLLNIVRPSHAYFGEKDFQQYLLIKKMVLSLFMPVEVISCETVRAEDGLALSSRNSRLTQEQRQKAAQFPHWLSQSLSINTIQEKLIEAGFQVDYIIEKWGRRLAAVWLGDIRLIDNVIIKTGE